MEQGAESLPSPPWFIGGTVVHMDIKPDNVFIGDYPEQITASGEDPNNFAMYPRFKLADFGLATDSRRNPPADRFYRGRGTPGFLAPEQLHEDDYPGQENIPPLNSKTNVWGVGITLMVMMNMNDNTGSLHFEEAKTDEADPNLVPKFKQRALNVYSARLRGMVLRCVRFRQANRPTFAALLAELRAETDYHRGLIPVDHARGARHATLTNLPGSLQPLMHIDPVDAYAVGLTMPPGHTAI